MGKLFINPLQILWWLWSSCHYCELNTVEAESWLTHIHQISLYQLIIKQFYHYYFPCMFDVIRRLATTAVSSDCFYSLGARGAQSLDTSLRMANEINLTGTQQIWRRFFKSQCSYSAAYLVIPFVEEQTPHSCDFVIFLNICWSSYMIPRSS